jgi:hypothetical protein
MRESHGAAGALNPLGSARSIPAESPGVDYSLAYPGRTEKRNGKVMAMHVELKFCSM